MRFAPFAIALGFSISNLASTSAFAATASASFAVSVTVQSACQASAPATAFGNYPTAGSTPVSVNCSLPTAYDVSLSADLSSSTVRTIPDPAKSLFGHVLSIGSAHIYSGGRSAGPETVARVGHESSNLQAAYSKTAWTQDVASGAFADAVTITITY
jgi:spore coat protein U-like protein